jgi:hypothetical protein
MIIIPKLRLSRLTDSQLNTFAQEKYDKLNGNLAFAAVSPSAADVEAKRVDYAAALAKASDGTKADTEVKNQLRKALEEMLTLQALDCARIANGDMAVYLTSGYEAKNVQGTPVGELGTTDEIVFRNYGKNPGELQPDWAPVAHARNYTVQVFTDTNDPVASLVKEVTVNPSDAAIGGLERGRMMWVRIRANGGSNNHGPWSDPAGKIVP